MGTQEYRANYRAAMQEANSQLAEMFREFEQLQLRKELLEDALGALEPFLATATPGNYESVRHEPLRAEHTAWAEPAIRPEPAPWPEPARYEPEVSLPVAAAVPSEPVRPAAFAPAPEVIVDPIQSRINRALGLAVA
ncbi:MAG TPA: hypothetical protein VGI45_32835 [Terracidiphilus sp.]|jgi:hypothetical protein